MASKPKATKAKADADASDRFWTMVVAQSVSLIREGFRIGGGCFIAWMFYLSVDVGTKNLAGKATITNISVVADVTIKDVALIVVAFGGLFYGRQQASLRKDYIKRLSHKQQELEARIDPARTSSGLTPEGDTNPKDLA